MPKEGRMSRAGWPGSIQKGSVKGCIKHFVMNQANVKMPRVSSGPGRRMKYVQPRRERTFRRKLPKRRAQLRWRGGCGRGEARRVVGR